MRFAPDYFLLGKGACMIHETISRRGTTLVKRLILEPGEATAWHYDPFHRVTIIVRGDALAIEYSPK
jgi:hypothetical protein